MRRFSWKGRIRSLWMKTKTKSPSTHRSARSRFRPLGESLEGRRLLSQVDVLPDAPGDDGGTVTQDVSTASPGDDGGSDSDLVDVVDQIQVDLDPSDGGDACDDDPGDAAGGNDGGDVSGDPDDPGDDAGANQDAPWTP